MCLWRAYGSMSSHCAVEGANRHDLEGPNLLSTVNRKRCLPRCGLSAGWNVLLHPSLGVEWVGVLQAKARDVGEERCRRFFRRSMERRKERREWSGDRHRPG